MNNRQPIPFFCHPTLLFAVLVMTAFFQSSCVQSDCVAALDANDEIDTPQNVLLIVADDLKASVLGCYGDAICLTPNLDRLAKSGMLYNRAYCQAMWCAPSRQSFMHSRYQGQTETNLGSFLIQNGYHTARVGKIYHMRVPGDIIAGTDGSDIASTWTERYNSPGLEAHTPGDYACLNLNIFTQALAGRQSTKMPHRPYVTVQYDGDGSDQPDFKSAETAIRLLNERAASANKSQPFFLAVGLVRPHYPMVAPRKFFKPYPWDKMPVPIVPEDDWDDIPRMGLGQSNSKKVGFDKFPENKKGMWAGYYASVSFMDQQVGKILNELDRLGLRETTTVIFTSDHGYHLGEHNFWQKSNLHEEVTRVPLIVDSPGHPEGQTDALVELIDLFPTVAELAKLKPPRTVQGRSLVPTLDGKSTIRNAAVSLHNGLAIRTRNHSYIRHANRAEELYDMKIDPKQFTNLAKAQMTPDLQAVLKRHRDLADSKLEEFDIKIRKKK